jgi:hypothetical protein
MADFVISLGSRVNPIVTTDDVIDYLIKRYNINPGTMITEINNLKYEKAKKCYHRLMSVCKEMHSVKCFLCDYVYQCEHCAKSMLFKYPYGKDPRNHDCDNVDNNQHTDTDTHITTSQCDQCMNHIEYYVR